MKEIRICSMDSDRVVLESIMEGVNGLIRAKNGEYAPSASTNKPCAKWPSFESVVESLNASLQSRLQRNMTDAEQNIVFSAFLDIGIKLGHIAQG